MMTLKTERQCEKKSVKGRFEQTENWTILKPAVFTPVLNLSIQKPQDALGLIISLKCPSLKHYPFTRTRNHPTNSKQAAVVRLKNIVVFLLVHSRRGEVSHGSVQISDFLIVCFYTFLAQVKSPNLNHTLYSPLCMIFV